MSDLPDRMIDALQRVYTADTINIDAFQHCPIVSERLANLKLAFNWSPVTPHALEFGVFKGKSIRALATANPTRTFTGFDSFEGLPEPWHRSETSTYDAGHFALPELPAVPKNAALVKGFFEDTLDDWLAANAGAVGFTHIDPDLYSAAKFAMTQITDRMPDGAVIVFDELGDWKQNGVYPLWEEGEWRALKEWLAEHDMCFRILGRGTHYEAAIQVFRSEPKPLTKDELVRMANLLAKSGAPENALTLTTEIAEAYPNWLRGLAALATRQTASKQHKEALETIALIKTKAESDPENKHIRNIPRLESDCHFALGDFDAAFETASLYVTTYPNDPAGRVALAKAAAKLTKFEVAEAAWQRAADLTGNALFAERAVDQKALSAIKPRFRKMSHSGLLIQTLMDKHEFETVLDVGSGAGEQARMLRTAGKVVTELDYGESDYFSKRAGDKSVIIGDFLTVDIPEQYDCVIASHVLEHQLNVHAFLRKAHACTKEGGVFGLSVPPLKHAIVGGHVSLWNAGLVLYNLVLAGFDCREAWVRQYGYNISVIVKKRTVEPTGLVFDSGDIDTISEFLPEGFSEGFDGDIRALN